MLRRALDQAEQHLVRQDWSAERLLGGGLVVTDLDPSDLEELFWLRAVLESELTKEVATRATAEEVVGLSRILDQMEAVSEHPELFIELGRNFHDGLATILGNERCRTVLRQVRHHVDRYWAVTTARQPERARYAAGEHRDILAAIRDHDGETAGKRMRAHILAEAEVCLETVRAIRVEAAPPNLAAGAAS